MKLLFLFFLLPLQIIAQDITGLWTGSLYNDTTKQFLKYELAINEYNGKLSGYSHTIFIIDSSENIGIKSVSVKEKDGEISIVDEKLIYNNYPEPPAKGVRQYSTLSLSEKNDSLLLTGSWRTNRTKEFSSITGTIFLSKKKLITKSLLIPKLQELGFANSLSFISKSIPEKNLEIVTSNEVKVSDSAVSQSPHIEKALPSSLVQSEVEEKNSNTIKKDSSTNKMDETKYASPVILQSVSTANKDQEIFVNKPGKIKNEMHTDTSSIILKKESLSTAILVTTKINSSNTPGKNNPPSVVLSAQINKTNDILNIQPLMKLDLQPAADIAKRKIETIKSVEIKQDSLVLSLFDNGEIDGDTVSVLLNGKVIMPRQRLMSKAINKTIYLTPEMGDSIVLIMYAENLGSIPPNTGLLVIHDGEDNFEIRFAGDLQKNSAIILKRKKKQ
jgi:hypothetical protein